MSERFMKDFNGEKVFSLEYDKETLKDMVLDKQGEIERLNNIITELEKFIVIESSSLGIIGKDKVLDKLKELKEKQKWKKDT